MAGEWGPISAAADDVLDRIDDFADRAARRVRSELPQYDQLPIELVVDAIRSSIVVAASAMRDQRSPTDQELESLRATGAERARAGIDLDGPLRALTIASRSLWTEQQQVARRLGADSPTLLEAQGHLWRLTELMGRQYIAGHREAELELSRRDYQQRVDMVRSVLLGRIDRSRAAEHFVSLGLDPDGELVVCRARPVEGQSTEELERALRSTEGTVVVVPHERDVIGLMTGAPALSTGVVGLSPPTPVSGLSSAFSLATRALTACLRFGLTGTHEFGSLGLLPAIASDHDVGAVLEARYLHPLRSGRPYDEDVEHTVSVYLDQRCRLEETAGLLHVHPNTLRKRLRHFADLTGADLSDPSNLAEVWWAFRSGRA